MNEELTCPYGHVGLVKYADNAPGYCYTCVSIRNRYARLVEQGRLSFPKLEISMHDMENTLRELDAVPLDIERHPPSPTLYFGPLHPLPRIFCLYGHTEGRYKNGVCRKCSSIKSKYNYAIKKGNLNIPQIQPLIPDMEKVLIGLKRIREIKQFCRHGHDTFKTGRYKNGVCRACRAESYIPKLRNICKKGHDKSITGKTKKGQCKECRRQYQKTHKKPRKRVFCPQGHNKDEGGRLSNNQCFICYQNKLQYKEEMFVAKQTYKSEQKIKKAEHKRKNEEAKKETREEAKNFCRHGHDKRVTGVMKDGSCLECSRIRDRKRAVYRADTLEEIEQRRKSLREKKLRWRQRNPEKYQNSLARRRHKRRALELNRLTGEYNYIEVVYGATHCALCNKEYQPGDRRSLDHIIPLSCGGTDTPDNVQSAHLRCNEAKGPPGWYTP
jgi:hypothetical protein